jgi:CDP-diacylglycerol--glycerol-3-phosphate 3-phosphatidyltransferase
MTIYDLKPRFQALLRPMVRRLHALGCTANGITLFACALSVAFGALLAMRPDWPTLYAFLPVLLFLRMALNAIDGMLARELGQKSALGAFLNELTDVIADAALYAPFAFLPHFGGLEVAAVVLLAALSEMTGVVAVTIGASRRYDGPMGKSDRAFVFGALGLAIGFGLPPQGWQAWVMPAIALLLAVTIVNRTRAALRETGGGTVARGSFSAEKSERR